MNQQRNAKLKLVIKQGRLTHRVIVNSLKIDRILSTITNFKHVNVGKTLNVKLPSVDNDFTTLPRRHDKR